MKCHGRLLLALTLLVLAGCAGYKLEPLTINHPAHPEALPGTEPPLSKTLAYTKANIPSARPIAADHQQGHGSRPSDSRTGHAVVGQGNVVATVPNADQLVIEHGNIEGFMDAMTMGYRVDPSSLLEGIKAGDRVRFTVDVQKNTIVKIEKLSK